MTLNELIYLGELQAQSVLIGTKKQMAPSWLLACPNGSNHLYMTPWNGDFEKEIARSYIRSLIKELGATAYSVIMESWLVSLPKGARPIIDRPSQDPRRQECVMIMAVDDTGYETKTLRILRDKATGKCNGLPEINEYEALGGTKEFSTMESPFLNLLK